MKKTRPTHDKHEARREQASTGDQSPTPTVEGRRRVAIEHVQPEIDGGRYPIKRVVGDTVIVSADLFADGHDVVGGILRYRSEEDDVWQETPLMFVTNDRWQASFEVNNLTDKLYYLSNGDQSTNAGSTVFSPAMPRNWALTLRRNFN